MKQLNLLKTLFLLCALVVGSLNSWADTVTFTAGTDKSEGTSITKGGITIEFSSGVFNRTDNYRCYSGASMTITSTVGKMTQIDFTATSGNPMTKFSGNPDTGAWTDETKTQWTGNADAINFGTTSGQCRIEEIVVTYTAAEKKDPTITFNNGSVNVGKTLDLSTLFTSNSTGAVTYSITEGNSYASIDGSVLTGVAVGSVTVQASQAAEGIYNAKAVTTTITVNAALTLTGISITTAPTKIVYTEGETFDATGMVVTATYSDSSTDDVTALCTWSPDGALTTSDTEITISYTENAVTKTATQLITVNVYIDYATIPFIWEGGKVADLKALTGVTSNCDDSNYADSNAPYYVKFNGTGKHITVKTDVQPNKVLIGIKKVGGKNTSTLKIQESSDGETFTDVEELYTEGAVNDILDLQTTNSFKAGTRYVRIYFLKEYNSEAGSNVGVGPISIVQTTPVTITSAKYATYVNESNVLDFSATGITAYTATAGATSVTLNEIASGKIPANTPVVLFKDDADGTAIDVPIIASAAAVGDNDLVKSTGGTPSNAYVLAKKSGVVGFYKWAGGSITSGKVYLQASTSAPEFLGFGDDTTGINEVAADKTFNGEFFNLAGQRVAQPTKGLYIVNGKKIVIK